MENGRESIADSVGSVAAVTNRDRWRSAMICLAIAFSLVIALFWEASSQAVIIWYRSSTFNHGFLIFPIIFYLIWSRRSELVTVEPRPNYFGLAGLALAGIWWLLGDAADVILVQQFALIAVIQFMTFTVLGWRATRIILFPLAYLFFAVPFGEFLVPPLQDLTAEFTVTALRIINVPVFLDGIFISIPNGNFEVAEACSGVRFLIAIVALGTLFAHLNYHTVWRRSLFVILSLVVPIIANGFRAFGIVYIGYASDMTMAVGADHLVYGWVFFAIVTFALLALGAAFREPVEKPPESNGNAGGSKITANRGNAIIATVLALLVTGLAPAYATLIDRAASVELHAALELPTAGNGWRRLIDYKDKWMPEFRGSDLRVLGSYEKNGRQVHMVMAYYAQQRQGAELVSSENSIEGGKFWTRAQSGRVSAVHGGAPLNMKFTRLKHFDRGRMVWQWYWVDDVFTGSPIIAKLRQAKAKMLGRSRAGAAIVIATDFPEQGIEAEMVLRDFLASSGPIRPMLNSISGN